MVFEYQHKTLRVFALKGKSKFSLLKNLDLPLNVILNPILVTVYNDGDLSLPKFLLLELLSPLSSPSFRPIFPPFVFLDSCNLFESVSADSAFLGSALIGSGSGSGLFSFSLSFLASLESPLFCPSVWSE